MNLATARALDAHDALNVDLEEQRRVLCDEMVRRVAHRLRALGCYEELTVLAGMSDDERSLLACAEAAAFHSKPALVVVPLVDDEAA